MAKKRATKHEEIKTDVQDVHEVIISAPSPKRKIVSANPIESVPTIYANNANVEASNWDIRIRLGQIQGVSPLEIRVHDLISVYMSHEHAKAFAQSLMGVVMRIDELKKKQVKGEGTTH